MSQSEVYLPLIYFALQGIFLPNFDDLHYIFLLEQCGMQKYLYDMLNVLTYVGIIFLTVIYNRYLTNVEVRTLILV